VTPAQTRWLWFAGLCLLLPWPQSIFGDALVPPVRYAILALAATAVTLREGAGGPEPLICLLFWAWTAGTAALSALLAWGVAHLLRGASPRARAACTLAPLALALLLALATAPYRTPFGRAPRGGLLEILS